MQSRTKIFVRLVRDCLTDSHIVLPADATVEGLISGLLRAKASCALIVEPQTQRLTGIVTEQDITRRIALRCDGSEPIAAIMTKPVRSVGDSDHLYYAIASMRRFGWRHMPVVDRLGHPVGLVDLHQALATTSEGVVRDIDRLCQEGSLDGLREIKGAQVDVAADLLDDNVPAPDIQNLLTHVNTDIHRRILEANIAAMKDEGLGTPPVGFCLIIMGSGGRGENYLGPDQDNGFILDDYPDSEHTRIDGYFIELAERFNRDLDTVGFPYCKGYVMARNPVWRKTRSQWSEQLRLWCRKRHTIAVQFSDIFFDFQGTYGEVAWADDLRDQVSVMVKASPAFLRELLKETSRAQVALGWFGSFVTEKDKPEHKGKMNLKHSGTLPLVSNLRILALRAGIKETGTRERIDRLHDLGVLDRDEWDYLRGAFRHITHLLLRQQLADYRDPGVEVGNYVHPDALSEREKDILINSFKAIDALANRVKNELTGELF